MGCNLIKKKKHKKKIELKEEEEGRVLIHAY